MEPSKIMSKLLLIICLLCLAKSGFACTDFKLTAQDQSILIARSMEFAYDFKSNLRSSPRGRIFQDAYSTEKPGLTWKAKYGYLFLDGLDVDCSIDGLNEQGLSFEYLYLPGETKYPVVSAGNESHALSYLRFGDWILSNFKTVAEVQAALPTISVYAKQLLIPGIGSYIFPLHAAIHDTSGKSIIVEFVDGKMTVHDNKVGVLTNSPTYPWHIANLRNYLNLTPTNPNPVKIAGITFVATGQGAGMIGLPGDISPPSRFIKIAMMLKTVIPAADALGAVNLAQHLINNVDIPLGFVREAQNNNQYTNELTQWVVFKDLTHKIFYYRTYDNLTLRSVDLSKVDFTEHAVRLKMPIATAPFVLDVTKQFLGNQSA